MTIAFKAEDWFRIKGRGWVAACSWPEGAKLSELRKAKKEPGGVTIDGIPVTITGIETFQPLYTAPIEEDRPAGNSVGLLVRSKDCPECGKAMVETPDGDRCFGPVCTRGFVRES